MATSNLSVFLKKKRNFLVKEKKKLMEKIMTLQQSA